MNTDTKSGEQKKGAGKRKSELTFERKMQYNHILVNEKAAGRHTKNFKENSNGHRK